MATALTLTRFLSLSSTILRTTLPTLSHSLQVFNPARCRMNRAGNNYSPMNYSGGFSERPLTEMAPLFPVSDYEHWLIVMEKPAESVTKHEIIKSYIQTLAKVLGSEEEAKEKIYNVSCERYFGFGCQIDEETSNKLQGLPGVLFVLPDSYVDAENKVYGGKKALGFVQAVQRKWGSMPCCDVKNTWHPYDVASTRLKGLSLVRPAIEAQAEEAVRAIKAGKVIAVPTDTLYGFACDAGSKEAVHKIYDIKGREHTKPLAICVGDTRDIQRVAVTDYLPHGLLDSLFPGPITVVLQRGESSILDKSLNLEADNIGVRVPNCEFIRIIARGSKSALALTSANPSGKPSSICITDFENLWEQCAYVYDGGELPSGRAGSTVVELTKPGKYKILRAGSAKEETVAILEGYSLLDDGGVK